jgi:integrase
MLAAQIRRDLGITRDMAQIGRIRWEKRRGKIRWFVDFRPQGPRVYTVPGIGLIESREIGELVLRWVRAEVDRDVPLERALEPYSPSLRRPVLVESRLAQWIGLKREQVASGERSPGYLKELERYAGTKGHIGGFWVGRTIHEIRTSVIQDWDTWLRARPVSAKTRRNVLGAFHAFCVWLERREEIHRAPRMPSISLDEHEPQIISMEIQDRILSAIPLERRGGFLCMALGVRPGEVRALNVSDYRDGWISVTKAYKGPHLHSPVRGTKGRKNRRVPVDERLEEWVEGRGNRGADGTPFSGTLPLFPNPTARNPDKRWIHQALREEWHRACKRVGISGVQMYEGTKHSTATDAIRRGVPLELVRRFFGHSDIRTTQRYVNLGDQALVHVLRRKNDD